MLIGIDASRYIVRQKTGVERYSFEIINGLSKIANKQKDHTLILYTKKSFGEYPTKWKDYKTKVYLCVMPFKRLWTQVRLSWEMLFRPPDVLFVPSHVLPIFHPKKSVVMIHDVAFKYFRKAYLGAAKKVIKRCIAEISFQTHKWLVGLLKIAFWQGSKRFARKRTNAYGDEEIAQLTPPKPIFSSPYSFWQYFYLNWSTKFAVKHAKTLIVPSEATKRDLVKFYKCPSGKITVIAHGIKRNNIVGNKIETDKILGKFWLKKDDKFMLFIGRLEAKKNLVRVIEAFNIFSEKFPDFKLVLAGNRGVGFSKIVKKVQELELKQKILMPGYINSVEKDVLLKNAEIFVFPSLYEGFGFPVLEAFSYKVPVLTSNSSSLPEVAGDAALLVDPKKVSEIAEAMDNLASNTSLREKLMKKGLKRSKEFSWEKATKDTFQVLVD